MPKQTRQQPKWALKAGSAGPEQEQVAPQAFGPVLPEHPEPPAASTLARFFGVPFLTGAAREVTSVHLCPSMVHLATIRDGSALEVLNRLTLKALDLGPLAKARLIAFRPCVGEDTTIEMAIAGPLGKGAIARYDVTGGRLLGTLPLGSVTVIQYSPDGKFVAAGNLGGQLKVWHLGAEGTTQVLDAGFEAQVESLAFHPEHPTLYATLGSGALIELELARSSAAHVGTALRDRAPGILFHRVAAGRQGYPIYLAGRDDKVYVVDTATGEVGILSPKVGPITGMQVLPGGGQLCVTGPHAVFLVPNCGPGQREHLAQVCSFDEHIYAAWELERDVVLVFYNAD